MCIAARLDSRGLDPSTKLVDYRAVDRVHEHEGRPCRRGWSPDPLDSAARRRGEFGRRDHRADIDYCF